MNQRFRRCERLSRKRDFDRLFRAGRVFHFREILIRALPSGLPHSRLGISVGKRLGNAVRRNRIKRLIREAYRLNKSLLHTPCDIVVVPRPEWKDLSLKAIRPTLQEALNAVEQAFGGK